MPIENASFTCEPGKLGESLEAYEKGYKAGVADGEARAASSLKRASCDSLPAAVSSSLLNGGPGFRKAAGFDAASLFEKRKRRAEELAYAPKG
jgi:hypothetical protein